MGNLKACLVFQDRVFCPDHDSHQDMIKELDIKDADTSKSVVRVELLPPRNAETMAESIMEPLSKWTLKVAKGGTPDWWDESAYRQRIEEAVEAWRKEHVFVEGAHIIRSGKIFACGSAKIIACDSAKVDVCDSATVIARDNAIVTAFDSAYVRAYDDAAVEAWGSSKVVAYGNACVEARGSTIVDANGNAFVKAFGSSKVEAYDNAKVEARGVSVVTYPWERKIVFPSGWTAETHD